MAWKRLHINVDKASTREGCGFPMFLLSLLYLALRSAIADASNTNLFTTILFFSELGLGISKAPGGKNMADSNHGITMSLLPRAITAQLLMNKKNEQASETL